MRRKAVWAGSVFAAVTALSIVACGGGDGGSNSPTSPTTPSSPATTITIGGDGRVSPSTLTVPVGSRVTFVNNHNRGHEMASDPHPEHTDCRELNAVATVQPGQSRQTDNLTTAKSCGFHDHGEPDNAGLRGRIVIQ
jgi:plastocyanin